MVRPADLVPYWIDRRRVVLLVAVLLVAVVGFFGWQVLQTRASLSTAAGQADLLQDQLTTGDAEGARETLADLRESTEDGRSSSDDVLWSIAAAVPWLGQNVTAIQTVAVEVDRVADEAAPPVVALAGQVSSKTFSPEDGEVDLAAVSEAAPAIGASSRALEESQDALADVDPGSLLSPLRGPVSTLKAKVDSLASVAGNADLAAQLLPEMLGGDGTRRYLLLNQNNAEIRPTGGIAGSFALITIKGGRLSIGTQGSVQDMRPLEEPVVDLTDEELSVFPSTIGTDVRDVNINPDFPRSAAVARALFDERYDIEVDGVVSIDPVALSYLLGGTGPVDLGSNVVLDQGNAVGALLNQVYVALQDTEAQDDFFELATRGVFEAFTDGQGDATAVLSAFVRGVDENRITFWAADEDEQRRLAPTALSGVLTGDAGSTPHVGVYLSDAASTKMEYFLDSDTSVQSSGCLDGDRQVMTVTTDLTSNAPTSAARLTPFITGTGEFVVKGSMRLNVRLFSPFDGAFTSVRVDGEPVGISSTRFKGRNVARVEVVLRPGETRTITANTTSGPAQAADPVVSTTPGIASVRNDFTVPSACG